MAKAPRPSTLYYGDNLDVLREYIEDESVDLIYLDPPFKSGKDYNQIYRAEDGGRAPAQIQAFEDTWTWGEAASEAFDEVLRTGKPVALALEAFRKVTGDNTVLAYMSMMAVRLVELHRVLKPTGSLYLHCDPTASHYLKIVLDAVFGPERFVNEIVWRRTNVHSDAQRWSPVSDSLLFYAKGDRFTWNKVFVPHAKAYVDDKYRHQDPDGRRYMLDNMTSPNPRPNMMYAWKGHQSPTMGWRYSKETMQKLDEKGRIWYPDSKEKRPRLKRYLDEMPGTLVGNVWTDIDPINSQAAERLGYPTQKPVALLERILLASSKEGDLVLDPFCGCGTAVHAAQKLKRRWIGIDITHLAIGIIKERMRDEFGDLVGRTYNIVGEPTDLAGAHHLAEQDRFQFELWALSLVGARCSEKKPGADKGVDGELVFQESAGAPLQRIILSVKSGHPKATDVRDLRGVIEREHAALGVLIMLHKPTKQQRAEAASAGRYATSYAATPEKYPRMQIITIEELLDGVRIKAPTTIQRIAAKRTTKKQLALALADGG